MDASLLFAAATLAALALCTRMGRDHPSWAFATVLLLTLADLGYHNVALFHLEREVVVGNAPTPLSQSERLRFVDLPTTGETTSTSLAGSHAVAVAIRSRSSLIATSDGGVLPSSTRRLHHAISSNPSIMLPFCGCETTYDATRQRWQWLSGALPRLRVFAGADQSLCDIPAECITADKLNEMKCCLVGDVTQLWEEPQFLSAEVSTPTDGRLVVADTWYPGWQCTVDGREAPVESANCVFRSVRVPAGSHRVEFVYRPASFKIGMLGSVAGAMLALLIAVLGLYLRRRRPHSTAPANANR